MHTKRFLHAVCFLLCLALVLAGAASVLRITHEEEGVSVRSDLESAERYPDVLVFGSSHVYTGLSPAVMFESEGVAAHLMASSGQPFCQTQYLVEDQLKRHQPKVVVVDLLTGLWPAERINDREHILMAARGIRDPLLRARVLTGQFGLGEGLRLFTGFYYSHSRYGELTYRDWEPHTLGKGEQIVYGVNPWERPGTASGTVSEVPQAAFDAVDHMIEVCRERGVELVFTLLPMAEQADARATAAMMRGYIEQQGGRFLDCDSDAVYDAMGLDFAADFQDIQHLNVTGQEKASRWLAKTLKSEFGLTDHRGEPGYESWQDAVSWRSARALEKGLEGASTLYQITSQLVQHDLSGMLVLMNVAENAAAEDNVNGGVRDNLLALGMSPDVLYGGGTLLLKEGQIAFQQAGSDVQCSDWIDGLPITADLEAGKGSVQVGDLSFDHNVDMGLVIYDLTEHRLLYQDVCYMR